MELTIDKFGRVLIPKPIRSRLNLLPGSKVLLQVNEEERSLSLQTEEFPVEQKIVYTDWGFPIIQTNAQVAEGDDFDTVAFIKETRDEYFKRKFGF